VIVVVVTTTTTTTTNTIIVSHEGKMRNFTLKKNYEKG
jgi:hypothetical protein